MAGGRPTGSCGAAAPSTFPSSAWRSPCGSRATSAGRRAIVLGAVASTPREAPEAAGALAGERLTPEVIDRAAERAAGPAKPLDNTDLVYHYRKKMTRVYVARALRELAGLPLDGVRPAGMSGRDIEERR